jgi:hypothetical protein
VLLSVGIRPNATIKTCFWVRQWAVWAVTAVQAWVPALLLLELARLKAQPWAQYHKVLQPQRTRLHKTPPCKG